MEGLKFDELSLVPFTSAGMLKLRGLPFNCTKHEVIDWFSDLPLAPISPDGCALAHTSKQDLQMH